MRNLDDIESRTGAPAPNHYAPPQEAQNTGKSSGRMIGIGRGLIALFLAWPLCVFIVLAIEPNQAALPLLSIAIVVAAVSLGRNHLLIVLYLVIAGYFGSAYYSRAKIDRFCYSINASTDPGALPQLAKDAGVKFRSYPRSEAPGTFSGLASDPFSMSEYGCRVRHDKSKILDKRLGF